MSEDEEEPRWDAEDVVDDGADGVSEEGVVAYSRQQIFGSLSRSWALAIASMVLSLGAAILGPFRAFGDGISEWLRGTLFAFPEVTDAAATASAESFASGTGALLGPLAFPAGVAVSALSMWIFLSAIGYVSISPLDLIRRRRG